VTYVDGVDLVYANDQASVDILNAALWPAQPGETHTFGIHDTQGIGRSVTMQAVAVTSVPVLSVKTIPDPFGPIGYILFNEHIATAEQGLIDAIGQLRSDGVTDLVLDIRYNGGGYLDIASEVAYMIAGPAPTDGRTFEEVVFNNKHPATNPVTGEPLTPIPFHKQAQGFSAPFGQHLPTLNLSRVFVLTGPDTCSASESIINSLAGVDVEVIQIGSTTCGKPYGFYPADNCGTTYFTIQFQGVNAKGFGDYANGFIPGGTGTPANSLPGCAANDDLDHQLGDPAEGQLASALSYRASGNAACLPLMVGNRATPLSAGQPSAASVGQVIKPAVLTNRNARMPTR
jgi:hypothetical protein